MYKYKTEPFKHQRQSLMEGAKPYNFAYFMEMGTGKTKVAIDNAAYLFQGEVASYQTLKKWENNDLFFYGNHLYDHWNANALSSDEFKTEYKKNDEFLSQFKNYLNLFAFTNGKPETCFTQKHIDLLKSLTTKRVFSSSNGINKDLSNFLFGRLSTFDSDSTVNKLWFRLGITNSKFKT